MFTIRQRNVHAALPIALALLKEHGIRQESRNGPVVRFPEPVTTHYERPTERVLFWPERDANPFFHFFECLWMIAGRKDVKFPSMFAGNMKLYSDDGTTFHGAYGWRWKFHFMRNQLTQIVEQLRKNPDDRRCVLQMWDAKKDLGFDGKDFPCNTQVFFEIGVPIDGERRLNMTVLNRSNDLVWGAYGANAVHFSFLHEYMAHLINVPVGWYEQVSNNLHAYVETSKAVEPLSVIGAIALDSSIDQQVIPCPYVSGAARPYEIMSGNDEDGEVWKHDLQLFLATVDRDPVALTTMNKFREGFFSSVALPLFLAHKAFRDDLSSNGTHAALEIVEQCLAADWKLAARQWLQRRHDTRIKKEM